MTAERAARWGELSENIPVGLYVLQTWPDGRLNVVFASRSWLTMLGLELEPLLADASVAFAAVHPDEREAFLQLSGECVAAGEGFRREGRLLVHGTVRWVRIASCPTPMGDSSLLWEGVVIDITDLKQKEQLQRTTEKMRSLQRNVQAHHRPVNLAQVVEVALLFHRRTLEQAGVAVGGDGLQEECWIAGEGTQLQIARDNLLRNALEAVQQARVRQPRLHLRLRRDREAGSLGVGLSPLGGAQVTLRFRALPAAAIKDARAALP